MADKEDEVNNLNDDAKDFLSNTEPPRAEKLPKIDVKNGILYEYLITGYETGIEGEYGVYTRYEIIHEEAEKNFFLGSSVDQKTMNRYIEGWLKEGHEWPMKVKFVRYPRKSQKNNKTYYDVRADLLESGTKSE